MESRAQENETSAIYYLSIPPKILRQEILTDISARFFAKRMEEIFTKFKNTTIL